MLASLLALATTTASLATATTDSWALLDACRLSRLGVRGNILSTTLHALLVRLLRHLQHFHQGLALVRLHCLLDVNHPCATLTTLSHFV
jgi:hypothetical protein